MRELVRRELAIVLGARATWVALAASALLVGHGFVLAVDLFSAASRSALGATLMRREMDPLAGVVRPLLGGVYVSAALLAPVIAARPVAIERERRTYGALALAMGGTGRVVGAKAIAALAGASLLLAPALAHLALWVALGGHLGAQETLVAVGGHALHLGVVAAIALAASAGARSVAQAITIAIGVTLASWAIDAGEGFAALAWLGPMEWASAARRLAPFERGVLSVGAASWMLAAIAAGLAIAFALGRIGRARDRAAPALAIAVVAAFALIGAARVQRGWDLSEATRASYPPATVAALRAIDAPISITVWLDRDDGRRAQLEGDALSKLRLARPDVVVSTPLDDAPRPAEGARDDGYGRVVVRVGAAERETRSTSRKELATLLLEAAGRAMPDATAPEYAGYPLVIEGARRAWLGAFAYGLVPGVFVVVGWLVTRSRRRKTQ